MIKKIVFNFSPIPPYVFIGEQECYKTSIDQETWHWTGEALEKAPPPTSKNEIAAANSDFTDWLVIANYVGTKYWLSNGSEHVITEFGITPPEDALSEKPIIPAAPKTKFLPLEFLDKFTIDEQMAVVSATMNSVPVKLWYDKLLAASFVDLNDTRTLEGLNALVSAGLLDSSRINEIMTPGVTT